MRKSFFNGAVTCVVAFVTLTTFSSCVDEKYELSEDNIDLTVTVFQEGISIPLGSTDKITLESLYSQLDEQTKEMIQELDGAYMFRMTDNMDLTEDIAEALKGIGGIDAVALANQTFEFPIDNIDLSGISIAGQKIGPEIIDVSGMIDVPDLDSKLPKIELALDPVSVTVPEVDANSLKIDLSAVGEDMERETVIVEKVEIPDYASSVEGLVWDKEMSIDDVQNALKLLNVGMVTAFKFEPYEVEVPLKFTLPEQIKSVKDIELDENAQFELIFEIENPLFTSGSIAPKIDADIHNLLHIDKTESGIEDVDPDHDGIWVQHIHDSFVMSDENDWRSDHVYHIDALALTPEDWETGSDGCLAIDKKVKITMEGELVQPKPLMTTLQHLKDNGKNPMKIKMTLKFNNFEISNVVMELKPVEKTQTLSQDISFNVDGLPELVKGVEYIEFDQSSPLNLNMKATIPASCNGMDITLETLTLKFPEGMVVDHENFSNRTLTYSNVSLTEGLDEDIRIARMNLPAISEGSLSYQGKIEVEAKAVASGNLNSKNLVGKPAEDITIAGSVSYNPVLKDYCVEIGDYKYDVSSSLGAFDPINVKLDKSVGEMLADRSVSVTPKQSRISIIMDYPDHKIINLRPLEGEGLVLDFPDMLQFTDDTYAKYNFSRTDNRMAFTGEAVIPKKIELDVDKINVSAVEDNGEYYLRDEIKVIGGVRLKGTEIHMADIEDIKDKDLKVIVEVDIPTIEPAEFKMDEFEVSIPQKDITIDDVEVEMPEMIRSVSDVELLLKDVWLDLEVDASSVGDLIGNDASVTMGIDIDLPKMFIVESTDPEKAKIDENNHLSISARLENGKISVDCIHVIGLDLSDVEIKDGKLALSVGTIPVTGSVKLENLDVNVDNLDGKKLGATLNGGLASRDAEGKPTDLIEIDKVKGKIDLGIDPVKTSIDLSEVAKTLNGEDMSVTVDLNTFYLVLDVTTNVDVPIKGNLEIIPYYGKEPGLNKGQVELELDPQARQDNAYRIFVSNMTPAESDGRYEVYKDYMCKKLDLIGLLYDKQTGRMADSLSISLNAGTDPLKDCTVEPSKDYELKVDYEVGVPLELGEKFAFEYRTVIEDLPETASQVFAYASVGLGGKVTNALPLNLDLQVYPLDSEGNVIPLKEGVGHMRIASCDAKGNPVTTKLDFVLSGAGTDLSDMKAVELVFRADAKDAAGVPLKADSFLKVELNARVPEGVTLDLKELMNSEDEEN